MQRWTSLEVSDLLNHVCLEAPDISNLHCVIARTRTGIRIRDCAAVGDQDQRANWCAWRICMTAIFCKLAPSASRADSPHLAPSGKLLNQRELDIWRHSACTWLNWPQVRRRLLKLQEKGLCLTPTDLSIKASSLRAQIRAYDQRLNQLKKPNESWPRTGTFLQRDTRKLTRPMSSKWSRT